jgi:prepilin-type N-terminal cleavage/methylation domain-containing protein
MTPYIPSSFGRRSRNPNQPLISQSAFTLIEFIGVLAILAIVAGIFATSLVGRLKRASRESEATSVSTMTDALRTRILRTQFIPALADIPQAIAEEISVPVSKVEASLAGFPRVFLIDPALQIGSPTGGTRTLPFQQTVRGSIQPFSPRFMLVSSLSSPLPITSPVSSSTFTSLWGNAASTIPSDWTTWKGESDDLRIGRIDFRSLFHRVVFNNLDPANVATYSISSPTNSLSIPVRQRFQTFFLATSALNLHFANGAVQTREFIRADTSYIFENGRWSRDITYGSQPPLGDFGQLVENFLQSEIPDNAKFGATPQAVVEEFFTYMYTYGTWASGTAPNSSPFETGGSTSEQQIPQYRVLKDCQARIKSFSKNLIK